MPSGKAPLREALGNLSVSRETISDLRSFAADVIHWTSRINLIGATTKEDLWTRHILDSAQILAMAPQGAKTWCDIGSGGGVPAIVLAILARDERPDLRFSMIESDKRKGAFLRLEIAKFRLNAVVIGTRCEMTQPLVADVVSARALAPLPNALPWIHRHLAPEGVALLHKGRNFVQEISDAQETWSFDVECEVSMIESDARILKMRAIEQKKAGR